MDIFDEVIKWYKKINFCETNEYIRSFDFKKGLDVVVKSGNNRIRPKISESVLFEIEQRAQKLMQADNSNAFRMTNITQDDYYKLLLDSYYKILDDDWKCDYGIEIETLDNPGWAVKIFLRGIGLHYQTFHKIEQIESHDDWICCNIENDVFKAYCDVSKLETIFVNFFEWIDPNRKYRGLNSSKIFMWLIQWYQVHCDGNWEHIYGIKIKTLDNPGWMIDIDLNDTELENKKFQDINLYINDDDWLFCKVENNVFKGRGDMDKLEQIIGNFEKWQEENKNLF